VTWHEVIALGIYDLEHGLLFADTDFVPAKGQQDRIGTIAPGKQADLVLIKVDPSRNLDEIENVETIFKAGVGYDSAKLIESVHDQVGIR
jgi:cytosine/adenosine deaminase-related metal-dependent hydrolase